MAAAADSQPKKVEPASVRDAKSLSRTEYQVYDHMAEHMDMFVSVTSPANDNG